MISELKCPFCGKPLWRPIGKPTWSCQNWDCLASDNMIGNHTIWEKLIQSQEDLEVARKALEEMQHWLGVVRISMISHLNNQNNTLLEHYETDPTVQNIDKAKRILKHYIEQIEHKEQI